jgi:DNA-binding SARP family transcriptional activator/WD40 repeat protein
MEFRVLGSVEVVQNGNGSIRLGGPKQRAVLAHLLLRANHLVPTEVLIDEVWGDAPPETARNAVQSYASHLRKALGPDRLEGSRAGYRLLVEPSEFDAATFQVLLRDARRLLPIDARAAVGALDRALDLWRGPAFADLAAESSLQAETARLEDLRLGALEDRIEAQLTIGQHAEVIGELEQLTTRFPLRERFWEQLMLALYRAGRQGEALGTYQRVRKILADDLGVDPAPELRRLHERILAHDPDLEPGGEPLRGYRLLERIGGDSLGSLYRATQPNVGRDVALRVVHEHRANDPAFVRRFESDAQAVAALEHPHVAPMYDYWREPGRACLVSRYLRGGSLAHLLDGTAPPDGQRATRILEQIASALAAAHRRGVAHGDLRASNVLFDDEGNAFLTDFSIGLPPEATLDDLTAFANLARETFGGRVPMSFGELLRSVESARRSGNEERPFAQIAASIGPSADPPQAVSTDVRNPYKGLRPFLEADAGDFFGREAFVARLAERMSAGNFEPRFVAVVGPSGSGKSSVVRAGLVAAIRAGGVPGSRDWLVTQMHPGHHPFEELDDALMRVAAHPPAGLLSRLESGPRGLVDSVEAIAPHGTELILIVDQFEEVFTLTESEDDRSLFLESLRVAAVDPQSRLRVIVTLRADFYDRPLRYPRMGPLLGSTTEVLSPLTPEELERAIVRPAEGSGLAVDSALVPQIAADVAEQPGGLPLIEYALTELFDRRDDGRLTLEAYREIGGVGGALASSAEHLYATRHEAGREAVRQLFLRLVTLGEGTADTRRRVPLSEFRSIEGDALAMDAVIDTYGRHRLLTFDRDPATREPTVEIAHEALLDAWERLRAWIDEARGDLRTGRRLSEATREWKRSGQDPSFLLAGSRLDQFNGWESSTSLALGLEERAYLSTSVARREDDRAAESARQEHERTLERRSVKRLRALVIALMAAVLLAATLTTIAVNRNVAAQRASRLATTRELVSAAAANLDSDRELAVLLALESVRTTRSAGDTIDPRVEEVLRRAAPAVSIDTSSILGSGIDSFEVTPDGTAMVLIAGDGSVGVWDLVTGARTFALRPPDGTCDAHIDCPDTYTVQLSEDGSLLAAGDGDGVAHVWDLESGREVLTVPAFARLAAGQVGELVAPQVAISADERLLATGRVDGAIQLWEIATGRRLWTIRTRPDVEGVRLPCCYAPWLLLFDSEGSHVFFDAGPGGASSNVAEVATGRALTWPEDRFWPAVLAEVPRVPSGPGQPAFAVRPNGYDMARLEGDHVRLVHLDTLTERPADPIRILRGHTDRVAAATFSNDGNQLATGSFDGTARVWSLPSGRLVFTSPVESSDVEGVAFSEDGSRVAVVYSDGRIIVNAIALDDVIGIARARVTRGFTQAECRTYLHVSTCPAA